MLSKRWVIVLLVGANLVLLAALLIGSYSLPAAHAAGQGRPGDFIAVTAQAPGQGYDVLYILDVPEKKLHALSPGNKKQLQPVQFPADLQQAFKINP